MKMRYVFGHTHAAEVVREDGMLWLNPGSASLRFYERPRSVGLLRLGDGEPEFEIVELGWDLLLYEKGRDRHMSEEPVR